MDYQKLINKQEIAINIKNQEVAFKEILLWGEASWWPKKSMMKFIRMGDGPIVQGTIYRQKVLLPFAPNWCSVITKINKDKSVLRKFFEGFIEGEEEIRIVPEGNSLLVKYCLEYSIPNKVHSILWKLCFENLHNYNIKLILKSLKGYLEQ